MAGPVMAGKADAPEQMSSAFSGDSPAWLALENCSASSKHVQQFSQIFALNKVKSSHHNDHCFLAMPLDKAGNAPTAE